MSKSVKLIRKAAITGIKKNIKIAETAGARKNQAVPDLPEYILDVIYFLDKSPLPYDTSTIQIRNIYESGFSSVSRLCINARHKPGTVRYNPRRPFESADPSKNGEVKPRDTTAWLLKINRTNDLRGLDPGCHALLPRTLSPFLRYRQPAKRRERKTTIHHCRQAAVMITWLLEAILLL